MRLSERPDQPPFIEKDRIEMLNTSVWASAFQPHVRSRGIQMGSPEMSY